MAWDGARALRTALFNKGWKQNHLAKLLDKSPQIVNNWTTGRTGYDFPMAWKISKVMEITLAEFVAPGDLPEKEGDK